MAKKNVNRDIVRTKLIRYASSNDKNISNMAKKILENEHLFSLYISFVNARKSNQDKEHILSEIQSFIKENEKKNKISFFEKLKKNFWFSSSKMQDI